MHAFLILALMAGAYVSFGALLIYSGAIATLGTDTIISFNPAARSTRPYSHHRYY